LQQLQIALDLYWLNQELLYAKPKIKVSWNSKNNQITYIWGIALQLSAVQKLSAMQIATMIIQFIDTRAISHAISHKLSTKNAVGSTAIVTHVAPPGLVYLGLTDFAVGSWLQYLTMNPPSIKKYSLQKNSSISLPFTLQYTHARCCSLLQLAAQEGLITLKSRKHTKNAFVVSEHTPISFLDSQQRLLCRHPTEQVLIKQLLVLLDNLDNLSTEATHWEKATLNLCQSWQNFYTHCRIWGEVKQNNLLLAQARLGLTSLTQSLLAVFLNDKLDIYAPTEL
jgi:hypothetical protein